MKLNHLKNEKGSVMVIVALMFTVLIGFGALTIDIGRVTIEKSKLQNAIDATVLAAAQELPNKTKALATAEQYIVLNGYDISDITVTFPTSNKIKIDSVKNVKYTFAKIIGFNDKNVKAKAVAYHDGQWSGEALPFINLDDDYETDPEIVAWEKTGPGDFESIENYEIVNPDDHNKLYFKVDYMNGIDVKKGTVADKKQEVGYVYDQHKPDKPVYILSLNRDVIMSGKVKLKDGTYQLLSKLKENNIIDPSQLVLLKCIFHDYDYKGKTLYLTVLDIYDIANNVFPPNYVSPDGSTSKLVE